ncbi:MAG: glutamine--tRNA ligase/YqeY domain fusion protein [Syntrophales bacterium]|jgi:glutaminyl-tRNA synthetase|nr:glutamine--tRNA ligase/YqeY domain fusion protein [Syntrophales bacterium]MCK9528362.1 glutamine--tRNA ligase/YqeY domain fusion protein [Syntrophales bacterium]MDX9922713.1 glutamine--tRNA ligase/YqeY domain fusion protein [Syntrophales bacterium]
MIRKESPPAGDFIRDSIDEDLRKGVVSSVATRFPPEPNGYLHIGHAKSLCLNFGIAAQYGGTCNLRMDDTDPEGESPEFVESIIRDVSWLGFDWNDRLYFASDYFEKLHDFAVALIEAGGAYVCDLSADEIREYRGTFTEPGRESPWRNRSVAENLDLFKRMREGEFADGERVLRARIDMASPNIVMRDPVLYRIKRESHYRRGTDWVIYPMYDFAHCLSDALEGITHSICTLEFENNRPLYDWLVERLIETGRPRQIEFARLNLSFTVLSKRILIELVRGGVVSGWDDPRMPTVAGMRRRGYTPEAIRAFCGIIGVAKNENLVDISVLEHCLRDDLNERAPRAMAVLRPLKVVIENYPENRVEEIDIPNHPRNPGMGTRKVAFSRELYIERDDYLDDPPRSFHRLGPGREVRLRNACVIQCREAIRDPATGDIIELRCICDPETLDGRPSEGRKVKGVIHWVSAPHAIPSEVRLYDRLFSIPDPAGEDDILSCLNPNSLEKLHTCFLEASLHEARPGDRYQFERLGYFCRDSTSSPGDRPVFNRIVPLRDSWEKIAARTTAETRG